MVAANRSISCSQLAVFLWSLGEFDERLAEVVEDGVVAVEGGHGGEPFDQTGDAALFDGGGGVEVDSGARQPPRWVRPSICRAWMTEGRASAMTLTRGSWSAPAVIGVAGADVRKVGVRRRVVLRRRAAAMRAPIWRHHRFRWLAAPERWPGSFRQRAATPCSQPVLALLLAGARCTPGRTRPAACRTPLSCSAGRA